MNQSKLTFINKLGSQNNPKYICVNDNYRRAKNRQLYVLIKNLETNEVKEVKYSNLIKFNPFSRGNGANQKIIDNVNKIGIKHKYSFICVNPNVKDHNLNTNQRIVSIKSLKTKEIKFIRYGDILLGKNPFNEDINRIEINKIQPQYEKLFKKLKINYVKEYRLSKNAIVDFVLNVPKTNKLIAVEVKRSDRFNSEKNQLTKYKKIIKKSHKNIESLILSDPKGNHKNKGSISLKQLEQYLRSF